MADASVMNTTDKSGKRARPDYADERLGNFVRGFLIGALAGGVAVLLNTRQSGAELRRQLRDRLDAWRAEGLALAEEARRAVADAGAWAGDDDLDWSPPPAEAEAGTLAVSTAPAAGAPAEPPAAPPAGAGPSPPADSPTQPLPRVSDE